MTPIFLTAFLVFNIHTQNKPLPLPEYGNIADLKDVSKVYVTSDSTESRKQILGEIKKYNRLTVVDTEREADFVIECYRLTQEGYPVAGIIRSPGQFEMRVYVIREGRQRVAWSKTKASMRPPAALLTRDFIKELKKSQGTK